MQVGNNVDYVSQHRRSAAEQEHLTESMQFENVFTDLVEKWGKKQTRDATQAHTADISVIRYGTEVTPFWAANYI